MQGGRRPIVVVGSMNVDWVSRVAELPKAGETVAASSMVRHFGGKGANQAIAAARQGAQVSFIGCIGEDDWGREYRNHLRAEGIDDSALESAPQAATGTAFITVNRAGDNVIVVAEGANGLLRPRQIRAGKELISKAGAVLVQWEVPRDAVIETVTISRRFQVPVVMNPSPIQADFPWGKFLIHTLIANETEAAAIFGRSVAKHPKRLSEALPSHGIQHLVVTRGGASTWGITVDTAVEIQTAPVEPLDTVGAGDAFAGTYTACLTRGFGFVRSIQHANVAGALTTLQHGAQSSIPKLRAVDRAVRRLFHPSTP